LQGRTENGKAEQGSVAFQLDLGLGDKVWVDRSGKLQAMAQRRWFGGTAAQD